MLDQEMKSDEGRLRRILGPTGLTAIGIGAIIGAGIFVMTGRAAAQDAGPAIMLSFAIAGVGCALAAFCYAEFASMVPVAGSAYTYAYATLGELLAWIIGWDLILEYAMSCATVAASWSQYVNEFIVATLGEAYKVPEILCTDPFSHTVPGAIMNLPAVIILALCTIVLVIGIRESAVSNAILVLVKVGVVLFVIAVGAAYISSRNWTGISEAERILPQERAIPQAVAGHVGDLNLSRDEGTKREEQLQSSAMATYKVNRAEAIREELTASGKLTDEIEARLAHTEKVYRPNLPQAEADLKAVEDVLARAKEEGEKNAADSWGLIGKLGLREFLLGVDDNVRSPFFPYGLSGLMLGASIVFFAFIGFDAISTNAEEARNPQRDVPFGIIASLLVCTLLYIAVAAVITGMKPYPEIDTKAAIASAFRERGEAEQDSLLTASAGLIATGALAGMTSVVLITFLAQARIFLAMSRDGLLPKNIFARVHPRFKTPHVSTILVGAIACVVAALTPVNALAEMVNIGTLFAFVVVCGAVLILRIKRPEAHRPFRCPAVFVLAPLGILVNITMMLFLAPVTWIRLVVWLGIGLVLYFSFGYWHSRLGKHLERQDQATAS
jgi:APA family basic amino acid/polyamine antiporter